MTTNRQLYHDSYPQQAESCKAGVYLFTNCGVRYGLCPYCWAPSPFTQLEGEQHLEAHHPLPEIAPELLVPACLQCHQGPKRNRTAQLNLHHPQLWRSTSKRNVWWSIPIILLIHKTAQLYALFYRALQG